MAEEETTRRRERTILWVVCLASFLSPFMSSSLNLAAPGMGASLHASAVQLNWTLTAFLLATAAFLVPCGRLGDLLGRVRMFKIGMVAFGLLTMAAGVASTVAALIGIRLLQGLAASLALATATPILIDSVPGKRRGRVLGISIAAVYVGLSAGPPLGGLIATHLGWRAIFLVCGALTLVVAAVAILGVPDDVRADGQGHFDPVSASLYAAGLMLLLGGLSAARSSAFAPYVLLLGAVLAGAFVWRERTAPAPVIKIALFANPVFALSNLAALVNYSATFAVTFLLSTYLQTVRGLPAREAGLWLLVQPVLMAVVSPLAGRLSDRVEPRIVSSIGMALTTIGLLVAWRLDATSPLATMAAALVLLGLGFGLFSSPNTNAVMSAVERTDYGVASATLGTMRVVGQAASMALVAIITAIHLGTAPLSPEASPQLVAAQQSSFLLFASLCGAGVLASLGRGRMHG
jgi:EmrB/QacA subfamily drug resistance transporter